MGASKRDQMSKFAKDWPDQIWSAAKLVNDGQGAGWVLPLAAIAVTGCRPAALEKGVLFELVATPDKRKFIRATVPGVKLGSTRGQPQHILLFALTGEGSHRQKELDEIAAELEKSPQRQITISYDAEGISTRLRELSHKIWPRRHYHISAYCYRELFSAVCKASGAAPEEIAAAMGHLSTESQGKYARASQKTKGGRKPFAAVKAAKPIKNHRSPMARFKKASALKKRMSPGGK